jgi:hypothetical protein
MLEVLIVVVGALILVVMALSYFTTFFTNPSMKDELDLMKSVGGAPGIGFLLEIVAGIVVIVAGGLALTKKA